MEDYSKLDNPYVQPMDTPPSPPQPEEPHIITQDVDQSSSPIRYVKMGFIAVLAAVLLGGGGSAFFMIKTTTDSLTKAAKTQQDTIDAIIDEANDSGSSFSLLTSAKAGYEDPFQPSTEDANPFVDAKNPFDEIGY